MKEPIVRVEHLSHRYCARMCWVPSGEQRAAVNEILGRFGIGLFRERLIKNLSAGGFYWLSSYEVPIDARCSSVEDIKIRGIRKIVRCCVTIE